MNRFGNLCVRKARMILTAILITIGVFIWYKYERAHPETFFGTGKGYNLIVVQLESFQNFVLNTSIQGQLLTPVMNKLSSESLYFPHIFQQIGSGNTSDAEFISNTSIYPVGATPMSSKYGDRLLPSMARLLHQRDYVANTFHVNDVSFWNRNLMYPALGFDRYYDKPYYQQAKFNRFGASDEELYRVGIHKLKSLKQRHQKFYAQFVSVSSHAPFTIPDDNKRLKLNPELCKKPLRDYFTAINYADYALGTFIDQLKVAGLWEKSVVVVYGDHFGLHKKKFNPKEISTALGINYHKQISTFNVPLLIHIPGHHHGKIIDQTGGQIDILPTLANIMGIDLREEGFITFGQDLINIDHNIIGMRYYMPTGTFFNNEVLFIPGKKGFEDGKATSLRTHQLLEDITPYKTDYDHIIQWMKKSDKYVQQLPIRAEFE
ncbi:LTA synthase family protein [Paenibacillus monticola]|uniref:Sulfatase-like hydrolase/transferase n=1 Tax=Paenibacillus monticola TaxID=2666075 RepID=A0A7X2L2D5_9BACL|nr:LTA synthase family protein [Paenibacillus monticola]MRN54757.1 sulfatase-like hydrolase/transferase [Paenibacillus monticola]